MPLQPTADFDQTRQKEIPLRQSGFRPDIEGLRAVAILLVAGFHAGITWLPGGFVGVDIFFVLSGYLITDLLVSEVEGTGSISFGRFYARRMRRLLPASLLMLGITLLASFAILSPLEVIPISKSAIAAAAYASNVWFIVQSNDYFSPDVVNNPLLHTWSLAVEEQFYLLWPVLVLFSMKRSRPRRMLVWVFCGVTLLSLVASVWLTRTHPRIAFFGTPVRAWEFAAGGLATLLQCERSLRIFRHGIAAWLGAALILFSGAWLDQADHFPGAIALIPVTGTILILIAGKFAAPHAGLFAMLESRFFQVLGGLSYSWYLWHWPILVFGRILFPTKHIFLVSILLLSVSLAVAWITHVLIENPIRFSRTLVGNSVRSLRLGAAMTVGGLFLGMLSLSVGHHLAAAPKEALFFKAAASNISNEHDCMAGFGRDSLKVCSFGPGDGTAVVLFGDSHAEQWLPTLLQLVNREHWHLVTLLKASCPGTTIPVYNPRLGREEQECAMWRAKALSYISEKKPSIVLTSNATGYVRRSAFQDPYARVSLQTWEDGTRSTLRSLNAAASLVVLLRDTPRPEIDVPTCLARVVAHPRLFAKSTCDIQENEALPEEIWQVETSAVHQFGNVSALDMSDSFCSMGECPPMLNGLVVYRDGNHMTSSFASSLAPKLEDAIRTMQLP